jgi:hypothetical protein
MIVLTIGTFVLLGITAVVIAAGLYLEGHALREFGQTSETARTWRGVAFLFWLVALTLLVLRVYVSGGAV